jgi:hypothetical protein
VFVVLAELVPHWLTWLGLAAAPVLTLVSAWRAGALSADLCEQSLDRPGLKGRDILLPPENSLALPNIFWLHRDLRIGITGKRAAAA